MIEGKTISLKLLNPDEISDDYVRWMNDYEINRFLDSKHSVFTKESLKNYVAQQNNSDKNYMFGIYVNDNNNYIGNIKVGGINHFHKRADIGLIIGNKNYWGQNKATEAIVLATYFAFNNLNLNKIIAGMYDINKGSFRAFEKAGYRKVGEYYNHSFFEGKYINSIIVEVCKENFYKSKVYEKFSNYTS